MKTPAKQCPEFSSIASVDTLSEHVWIQELPTGETLRFQISETGLVTFAVDNLVTETVGSLPLQYHCAAQLIIDQVNRTTFLTAVDGLADVTFSAIASWNGGIE